VLFSPRLVVQLVRLKGGAGHHTGRRSRIAVGLDALPQGMQLFARDPQCPRQTRRGLALGDAAQQQDQGGGALPGFREDCPGQQGVIPLTGPTPVRRKVALGAEPAPRRIPTPRAYQPLRVEVTFQPDEADAIVHELGNRELNHIRMISHPAR
jgi:hypothetical protein